MAAGRGLFKVGKVGKLWKTMIAGGAGMAALAALNAKISRGAKDPDETVFGGEPKTFLWRHGKVFYKVAGPRESASPILPVAVTGTRECMPKGTIWPRRVPVKIRFGKPFVVLQRRASGERVSHEDAADAIMLAIAELLPPELRGRYSDVEGWRRRLEGVTNPV